jgi:acyl carrier protein phosphodiesterase
MVGNFVADSIQNRDVPDFPEGVQDGIALHRKIDSYTDSHPKVLEGTKVLHERHHKYAPVLIDVYFDYFLSKNWNNYSNIPLSEFTSSTYKTLEKYLQLMPPALQHRLPLMIADNWLMNYTTREGLEFTFDKMKRRVKYPGLIEGATDTLFKYHDHLNQVFLDFFPDVIDYVKKECEC